MTQRRCSVVACVVVLGSLSAFSARSQPGPASPAQLDIIYTGNTGGLRDALFSAPAISLLARQLRAIGGAAQVQTVGPGALGLGDALLLEPRTLRRRPLLRLLAQQRATTRVLAEHLPALEGEHDITFQYPPNPELDLLSLIEAENTRTRADPTLHRIEVRLLEHQTKAGACVLQLERGEHVELIADARRWDALRAAHGSARIGSKAAAFYSIFKALGSGTRRARLLERLRGEVPAGTALLLSGGNETSTVDALRPERTSPVRELDFATLAQLAYAAVVPGYRELYFGLDELRERLKRSPLPMVATNLLTKNSSGQLGAAPFPRYLVLPVGGAQVAVLGLVSPDLAERVRGPELVSGLAVTDAASATREALAQLRKTLGRDPDLVVVISALAAQASAAFLSRAQGVDIYIGDFGARGLHAPEQLVTAGSQGADLGAERQPLLRVQAGRLRVGQVHVELALEADRLVAARLTARQYGVVSELPRDERLQQQLTALPADDLDQEDVPLIPSLAELEAAGNPAGAGNEQRGRMFTPQLWGQLVANLLRASSEAEVGIIRVQPTASDLLLGTQVESTLFRWVFAPDPLVLCELTGAQLKALAQHVGETAIFSGFDVAQLRIGGRPVNDTERYRAVVAAPLMANAAAQRLLQGVEAHTHLRLTGTQLSAADDGRVVRLGEVMVAMLRQRRGRAPGFEAAYLALLRQWLSPPGSQVEPRWSFGVEALTLSFTGYTNSPRDAWLTSQHVHEARVSTPDNYAALVKGTLFVSHDAANVSWKSQLVADFAYTVVDPSAMKGSKAIVVKPADVLWIESEIGIKRLSLDLRPGEKLRFIPYVTAAYDTEFVSATDPVTGFDYPRRKNLYASVGLMTHPPEIIKLLRVGGLARTDFAAGEPHVDGGLFVATKLEFALDQSLLRFGCRLRYFVPTSRDTVGQLGFILDGYAKLMFPLTRSVALSLDLDAFAYRPKILHLVDETTGLPIERGTSLSVIYGIGLTFDHLWKL